MQDKEIPISAETAARIAQEKRQQPLLIAGATVLIGACVSTALYAALMAGGIACLCEIGLLINDALNPDKND